MRSVVARGGTGALIFRRTAEETLTAGEMMPEGSGRRTIPEGLDEQSGGEGWFTRRGRDDG